EQDRQLPGEGGQVGAGGRRLRRGGVRGQCPGEVRCEDRQARPHELPAVPARRRHGTRERPAVGQPERRRSGVLRWHHADPVLGPHLIERMAGEPPSPDLVAMLQRRIRFDGLALASVVRILVTQGPSDATSALARLTTVMPREAAVFRRHGDYWWIE